MGYIKGYIVLIIWLFLDPVIDHHVQKFDIGGGIGNEELLEKGVAKKWPSCNIIQGNLGISLEPKQTYLLLFHATLSGNSQSVSGYGWYPRLKHAFIFHLLHDIYPNKPLSI